MRALILALLLAACASAPRADQTPQRLLDGLVLDGTSWVWIDDDGQRPINGPTIRFEDGRASGSAGCNQWTGSYTMSNQLNLRIHVGAVTERACAPELMAREQLFLERVRMTRSLSYIMATDTFRLIGPEADTLAAFAPAR